MNSDEPRVESSQDFLQSDLPVAVSYSENNGFVPRVNNITEPLEHGDGFIRESDAEDAVQKAYQQGKAEGEKVERQKILNKIENLEDIEQLVIGAQENGVTELLEPREHTEVEQG
jgi:hypothetical protein